jgi:3-oxoacyl-[acyl-carrier protein] reductase
MFEISLKQKIAWVTGSSRGIGRAVALRLADAGADVAVCYREHEAEAGEVCREIAAKGVRSLALKLDVCDEASCLAAFERLTKEFGGSVDILVNAAGVISDNLFLLLENNDWQKVLQTNVMGTVNTTKLVIEGMMMKRWGRVIQFSSVAAVRGGRGQANYAASKGAIEAMTRSLAVEIGRRGITVNCIAPGVVETDMSREVIKLAKQEILDRQIIKRFASPDEIAAWAVMLASEHAGFITGEVIRVDGGLKLA